MSSDASITDPSEGGGVFVSVAGASEIVQVEIGPPGQEEGIPVYTEEQLFEIARAAAEDALRRVLGER